MTTFLYTHTARIVIVAVNGETIIYGIAPSTEMLRNASADFTYGY